MRVVVPWRGVRRGRRLFVYGTLRRGQPAHHLMGAARFLGACRTTPAWRVLDLGEYPGLVPGDTAVAGELYEVDDETLATLDEYEGCPTLFVRVDVELDDGSVAQTYRKV